MARRLAICLFFFGGLVFGAACGSAPTAKSAKGLATSASAKPNEPRVERILVAADRVAVVMPEGKDPNGAVPNLLVLGRRGLGTRVFFHFEVTLPDKGTLKSAAILLTRSNDVDMAPSPVELHAERIVDPWDARFVSWPEQPRLIDARTEHAFVRPDGPSVVRVDAKSIVQTWPLKDTNDQGIALVADGETPTGAAFSYLSRTGPPPTLEVVWAYPDAPKIDPKSENDAGVGKKPGVLRIQDNEEK
ncbi:MAG TPA: DNRLRE domain-containing protein [Polyangiaceae bacterium]